VKRPNKDAWKLTRGAALLVLLTAACSKKPAEPMPAPAAVVSATPAADANPLAPGGACSATVKISGDDAAKKAGIVDTTLRPSKWGAEGCIQRTSANRYGKGVATANANDHFLWTAIELGASPTPQEPKKNAQNPQVSLHVEFPRNTALAAYKWDQQLVQQNPGDPGADIWLSVPNPADSEKPKLWACRTTLDNAKLGLRPAAGKFVIEVRSVQGKPPTDAELVDTVKQAVHGTAHAECPPAVDKDKPNEAAGVVTLDITF
jgi:hypothetical protein